MMIRENDFVTWGSSHQEQREKRAELACDYGTFHLDDGGFRYAEGK